tara:strand:+ start:575 stop:1990 length:1416 start_codon:yes stop_codon:yes gene_type:complete
LQISRQAAASELLARRRARASLIEFTKYTNAAYAPAPHHALIAAKLEGVARGEIKRLMICMPPRHGKSELASRRFPAWYMGQYAGKQVIAASYNSDLANDFGREVRNIVACPEFRTLFDVSLAQDSQAANRWHTNEGGMYVAAGVGTAITGRGADVLLIDDPFKDRQEADSEVRRKAVWDWYTSTAYTRLMPGGAIVVINTRWHDDDLSGRLLLEQDNGGDTWDVLSLPAIDAEGAALWPDWYPLERLEQIRSVLPARDWNALYQQDPIPDDGDYFKAAWFSVEYDKPPSGLRIYGASDYAVTDGGGDYTEHGVFGIDAASNIYPLAWWYGQTAADEWIERWCDLIAAHEPMCWFGEAGPIRRSIEPFLKRRMIERELACRIEWLPSIADKPTRARGFQASASMGRVIFPASANWKAHVMAQLLRFPAGKHDDAVDVCSLIGRGLQFIGTQGRAYKPRDFATAGGSSWMAG